MCSTLKRRLQTKFVDLKTNKLTMEVWIKVQRFITLNYSVVVSEVVFVIQGKEKKSFNWQFSGFETAVLVIWAIGSERMLEVFWWFKIFLWGFFKNFKQILQVFFCQNLSHSLSYPPWVKTDLLVFKILNRCQNSLNFFQTLLVLNLFQSNSNSKI